MLCQVPDGSDFLPEIWPTRLYFVASRAFADHAEIGRLDLIATLASQILHREAGNMLLDHFDELPFDHDLVERVLATWTRPDRVLTSNST